MNVLGCLVGKADHEGLLQPLSSRNLLHDISFYANDLVLFFKHVAKYINLSLVMIQFFGEALGLCNNV
jgi:hypothetical protein